ncbi:hypothetical protein BDV12DRAFT_188772 [Aspergillus spectabilis]
MDTLTLKQRAARIAELATSLAEELSRTGHPEPSFRHGLPAPLLGDAPVSRASQIHIHLARMVDELNALLTDPTLLVTHDMKLPTLSVYPLIRLGIASDVSDTGSSVPDLAKNLGLDESLVRRLLAHSATYHVYYEAEPDFFIHTAASRLLAMDGSLREWIAMGMEETLLGALKIADALIQYPRSPGWSVAYSTDKSIFQARGDMPQQEKRFARAMQWRAQQPGFALHYLADFTVVGVGGGLGHVSRALAEHAPNARFIVQDTESVIGQGGAALSVSDRLHGRVQFQVHDFFEEQPAHGADVYLLRFILHDWSDKYVMMILRALVPALRPGKKVVINDRVLPGYHEVHYLEERRKRALLSKVDERFELMKVHQPAGSVLAVVEVTWTA